LETALPLFLTAMHEGRLSEEDLIQRVYTNPRRIFNLSEQENTWIEVDPGESWVIQAANTHTRCGWTPFEGWQVRGRVKRVVLRGRQVFLDGEVLPPPGYGRNVR
jgi:carbamoyl-phosphate synthase/aspartate carbamoyltransferase/dihydroorotase